MVKFSCNKIARDKSVESMKEQGITAHYKLLTGKELANALGNKLLEEALEVKEATDRQEVIAELADLFEVIEGLCKVHGITHDEIILHKELTKQKKGGFEKGIFVDYIEMSDTNERVKHFRKSPEKYPEI